MEEGQLTQEQQLELAELRKYHKQYINDEIVPFFVENTKYYKNYKFYLCGQYFNKDLTKLQDLIYYIKLKQYEDTNDIR